MSDVNKILKQVDELLAHNKGYEAEKLLQEGLRQAVAESDDNSLLTLLNELMGYYREISEVEASYRMGEQARALLERMNLQGTIPYANTMLNIANAYRAGGRLEDSMECYRKVMEVYRVQLEPDDMLVASLLNNISLLYQEMGEFDQARESLLKALEIVEKYPNTAFETAVTYANLAATCLELSQDEEAAEACRRSIMIFERENIRDTHYCAALSSMGTYYYKKKNFVAAADNFRKAMDGIRKSLGENEFYQRVCENLKACECAMQDHDDLSAIVELSGLVLCQAYYETYGKNMIHEQFPDFENKIAVGLVGEGSDCFGFDDDLSRDHDWGPGFCMWLSEETFEQIGRELQSAYDQMPREFRGYQRNTSWYGKERMGVMTISSFYQRLLGRTVGGEINWSEASDSALAAAVNGKVFRDDEGIFTAFRSKLKKGYPEPVLYLKIAESVARFSQTGQYNYSRMLERGEKTAAQIMIADCLREAMKLCYYTEGCYPPHDKWLHKGLLELSNCEEIYGILTDLTGRMDSDSIAEQVEKAARWLAHRLYTAGFISDTEPYLDTHTQELLMKSAYAQKENEELVDDIAKIEFEAFDKVRNVEGRASCQNDWPTFSIMRKSQYLTWNRPMLLQYLYDFQREYNLGHNLIEEKYGRMMASTAPEEYAGIAHRFPEISDHKGSIIESIVRMQVDWMEEFAVEYPSLAENARSIHTREDNLYNTSYETYLRGEISTYSDKMLELYGRYVVEYAKKKKNLTADIMLNSVKMYGYGSLEEACLAN